MLDLYLIHGQTCLDENLDDRGFNGPRLHGVTGIHVTYGNINIHFTNETALIAAQQLTGWDRFGDTALSLRMAEDRVEVRGFTGHDNHNAPLTDATVYFGDWGLTAAGSEQAVLTREIPQPRQAGAAGGIDYVKTAQTYGFAIVPWVEFIAKTDLPDGLLDRALETQKSVKGSQVLYDPADDAEGFMLIGDDPAALAKDWAEFSAEVNSITYTYSAKSLGY